jgi:hypothetical protein
MSACQLDNSGLFVYLANRSGDTDGRQIVSLCYRQRALNERPQRSDARPFSADMGFERKNPSAGKTITSALRTADQQDFALITVGSSPARYLDLSGPATH